MTAPNLEFTSGSYSVEFDPNRGALQRVKWNGEVLASDVYPAARNAQWGTLGFQDPVTEVKTNAKNSTELRWKGYAVDGGTRLLRFEVTIRIRTEGVSIECEAHALRNFDTQRTGLCLHHSPDQVCGRRVTVNHPDGAETSGRFPTLVAPHQPFTNIAKLKHEVDGGVVEIAFEGEVFEMEDQRNWSDFSFKTYCRPLDQPRPYAVSIGTTIRHAIHFHVEPSMRQDPVSVRVRTVTDGRHPIPNGPMTFWCEGGDGVSRMERLKHVLSEDPSAVVWIHGDTNGFLRAASTLKHLPKLFVVSDYMAFAQDLAMARKQFPESEFVAGSAGNFTDLNRNRPGKEWDGVAFAVRPDVHQVHERAISETRFSWSAQVQTARSWGFDRVHLGPIFAHRYLSTENMHEVAGSATTISVKLF